jgi:hypothetical protein
VLTRPIGLSSSDGYFLNLQYLFGRKGGSGAVMIQNIIALFCGRKTKIAPDPSNNNI